MAEANMFRSVLVANRGEIACRIIRTVQAMGMRAVAVYSDADAHSAHVRAADTAIHIGPSAARDSYLNVERIVAAARQSGANAIHPGYGFLSEQVGLVTACAANELTFVGPPVAAMAAMGSKSAAKAAARAVGVPVLPGYDGDRQSLTELAAEGAKVGVPLMVKPSGGGGGKGMQVVTELQQLPAALQSARRLAVSAFGDPTLLLERYLATPRHIEVQIIADSHGNIVALFDRDCSVQRRHQKLIEEAPAPGISDAVRQRMYGAAIAAARNVGYMNAGTVEFLYQDGEFWFMEMNARLQVEHPVTEMVTGIDLVEWQLRVAAGESLGFTQQDIRCQGHAIEARVCAENPEQDFAPCGGRLLRCDWPAATRELRVDAGFAADDVVPSDYDSLLGKVISYDKSREAAVRKLAAALRNTRIAGLATNTGWLQRALLTNEFIRGEVTTAYLAALGERLSLPATLTATMKALPALAVLHDELTPAALVPASPWRARDGFRPGYPAQLRMQFQFGSQTATVEVDKSFNNLTGWRATVDSVACSFEWTLTAVNKADVLVDGQRHDFYWNRQGDDFQCWLAGQEFRCDYLDPRQLSHRTSVHEGALTATLPGTVVMIGVKPGAVVEPGTVLMVVEAMKMEHAVLAPYAGTVSAVHFDVGQKVQAGAPLIDLTPIVAQA
jgi:3-methylcrotonyl-CoA carboxylase alpha subunit